jgi:hypothetical protein
MYRFYEVSSGKILIQDKDIKDINIASLREIIGIVSQEVFIFNASIYANLVFGDLDISSDFFNEISFFPLETLDPGRLCNSAGAACAGCQPAAALLSSLRAVRLRFLPIWHAAPPTLPLGWAARSRACSLPAYCVNASLPAHASRPASPSAPSPPCLFPCVPACLSACAARLVACMSAFLPACQHAV